MKTSLVAGLSSGCWLVSGSCGREVRRRGLCRRSVRPSEGGQLFSTDGLGLDSHLKTFQDGRTGGGKLILSQVLSCQLSPGVGVYGDV